MSFKVNIKQLGYLITFLGLFFKIFVHTGSSILLLIGFLTLIIGAVKEFLENERTTIAYAFLGLLISSIVSLALYLFHMPGAEYFLKIGGVALIVWLIMDLSKPTKKDKNGDDLIVNEKQDATIQERLKTHKLNKALILIGISCAALGVYLNYKHIYGHQILIVCSFGILFITTLIKGK